MTQISYAMRFTGQATPVGTDGNVLHASTSSPSTTTTSRVGPDGLTGLITSNFFVDDQRTVVDHQFGVILLP